MDERAGRGGAYSGGVGGVSGAFVVDTTSDPVVRMRTQRIGLTSFDLQAPITEGRIELAGAGSRLRLMLDLARVRVGNPLMQAAARALVGTEENSRLTFDARSDPVDHLRFSGRAQAGDVIVPMDVAASVEGGTAPLALTLVGWARFTDVHIPLPGMSRVNTIELDVSATLTLLDA